MICAAQAGIGEPKVEHGRIMFTADEAAVAELSRSLVEAGVLIHELAPQTVTLEDLFFSLTEGDEPPRRRRRRRRAGRRGGGAVSTLASTAEAAGRRRAARVLAAPGIGTSTAGSSSSSAIRSGPTSDSARRCWCRCCSRSRFSSSRSRSPPRRLRVLRLPHAQRPGDAARDPAVRRDLDVPADRRARGR